MGRSAAGSDACPYGMTCYTFEVPEHAASVAAFYLDTFETTVGRFRRFVQQYNGTPPSQGAAAHPLIAGSGWQSAWNASLPSTQAALISNLKCSSSYQTWTDAVGANEQYPINCLNWYEAFAFCAWDGGRLPTEAEWEFAAAGGSENRLYPWGPQTPDATRDLFNDIPPFVNVGSHPAGVGRWGHHNLAGSIMEFALDWFDANWYSGAGAPCHDCANLTASTGRSLRGGSWNATGTNPAGLRSVMRYDASVPLPIRYHLGVRCARNP